MQEMLYPEQRPLQLTKVDLQRNCSQDNEEDPAFMQFHEAIPDSSAGDASLSTIDFEFILFLEIACPIFQATSTASDALQEKAVDLAAGSKVDGVLRLTHSKTGYREGCIIGPGPPHLRSLDKLRGGKSQTPDHDIHQALPVR